ncbi:hypothetical protein Q7689_35245, partial [Nocardiopsis tropica]|nr:hypothetical protein [Nocardiopsis tropica]
SFERGAPRVFDLMAGADGLHSATRRLVFGPEERYRRFLGGHVAVFGLPEPRGFDGRVVLYRSAGRTAAVFPVRGTGRARGALLFRGEQEFAGDHRDTEAQRRFLRAAFAGEGWEVPRLLDAADHHGTARPSQQGEQALLTEASDVPRVQPPVPEHARGLLRPPQVLVHQEGRAHPHPAPLVHAERPPGGVADLDPHPGDRT